MRKTRLEQVPDDRHLLERFFAEIASRIAVKRSDSTFTHSKVEKFFSEMSRQVEKAENQQRRIDRKQATGFNVFDFIDPDENKLSDVLAWLLDPQGSHGQGDVFLLLLFEHLGFGSQSKHTMKAKVQREAPTIVNQRYRRRMDVLVEAGSWVLVIENKVDSPEQYEQVKDYLDYLRRRTHGRFTKSAMIYLTPDCREPSLDQLTRKSNEENRQLHCWNYCDNLHGWLKDCRDDCEAETIKFFLTEFLGYIESVLKRGSENKHEEDEDDN
jgi:hypothetical protein